MKKFATLGMTKALGIVRSLAKETSNAKGFVMLSAAKHLMLKTICRNVWACSFLKVC